MKLQRLLVEKLITNIQQTEPVRPEQPLVNTARNGCGLQCRNIDGNNAATLRDIQHKWNRVLRKDNPTPAAVGKRMEECEEEIKWVSKRNTVRS